MILARDVEQALLAGKDENCMDVLEASDEATLTQAMKALLSAVPENEQAGIAHTIVSKIIILKNEDMIFKYLEACFVAFNDQPLLFINAYMQTYNAIFSKQTDTAQQKALGILRFFYMHRDKIQQGIRLAPTSEPSSRIVLSGLLLQSLIRLFDQSKTEAPKSATQVLVATINGFFEQVNRGSGWYQTFPIKTSSAIFKMLSLFSFEQINKIENFKIYLENILKNTLPNINEASEKKSEEKYELKKEDVDSFSYYLQSIRLLYIATQENASISNQLNRYMKKLINISNQLFNTYGQPTDTAIVNRYYIGLTFIKGQIDKELVPESITDFLKDGDPNDIKVSSSRFEKKILHRLKIFIGSFNEENSHRNIHATLKRNVQLQGFQLDALVIVKHGDKQEAINVEIDGEPYHSSAMQRAKNLARDRDLNALPEKYTVVRLYGINGDINFSSATDAIEAAASRLLTCSTTSTLRLSLGSPRDTAQERDDKHFPPIQK